MNNEIVFYATPEGNKKVEDSVIRKIRTTADDDKNYQPRDYNLDAIIAVGYRVNSYQATQFRIGAYPKKPETA